MFELEISKRNGHIIVELNERYSIAQLDIALKDICIQLKILAKSPEGFMPKESGLLKISVSKKELSDEERVYAEMKIIPSNKVSLENDGFSLQDIQQVLQNIKLQLPSDYTSRFMYHVDFETLTVE